MRVALDNCGCHKTATLMHHNVRHTVPRRMGIGNGSHMGAVPWTDILQYGARTGIDITRDILGGPRPGTQTVSTQTAGPYGTSTANTTLRAANIPGAQISTFPGIDTGMGGDFMQMLLIGGVIIIALKTLGGR